MTYGRLEVVRQVLSCDLEMHWGHGYTGRWESYLTHFVDRGSTVVKGAVLQIGRSLVRSQLVDSASNRKEYQEYFLGVKAAGA